MSEEKFNYTTEKGIKSWNEAVKYVNKHTGEIEFYKTVANAQPDKGIENTGEDLCRKEDFEPIGQVIARFLRSGGVDAVLSGEYAYTEADKPDINEDSAFDAVDDEADILDQQMDLEEYIDRMTANYASGSAVEAESDATEERSQKSDEVALSEAEEKPSEV